VALTCRLASIVLAELDDLLLRDHRLDVVQFLEDLGLDHEWLTSIVDTYRLHWTNLDLPIIESIGTLNEDDALDPLHSQFAQHLLAAVRANRDVSTLQADLTVRVRTAFESATGFSGCLPDCGQPVLVAWGLGMRCGDLDSTYPLVPAVPHSNDNIQAAYAGLLHYLADMNGHYGNNVEEWPEMVRSAVLWRIVAIFDGLGKAESLDPDGNGQSAAGTQPRRTGPAQAASTLTAAAGSYLTLSQRRRYGAVWDEMVFVRDGLSHIIEGDQHGSRDFLAAAPQAANWPALGKPALEGLTAIVMYTIVDDVAAADPVVAQELAEHIAVTTEWIRKTYEP
jgi:hypothetical protein